MSILPLLTLGAVLPPVLARRNGQPARLVLMWLGLSVLAVGAAGLSSVFLEWRAGWVLVGALPLLCLLAAWHPAQPAVTRMLDGLRRRRALRGALLGTASLLAFVGGVEWVAFVLVHMHVFELEEPMRVLLARENEDWRNAIVIANGSYEPDPVLFWRTPATAPYNSQRLDGPVVKVPKPDGVFRIACYGDSNTDGANNDGAWPRCLRELLAPRHVEVLNAGVQGYSSHQGLMRFREEAAVFTPDLVLVSFGWNDAPEALGKADGGFTIPPAAVVTAERLLLRLRSYRLLRMLLRPLTSAQPVGPRVSVADYVSNLEQFGQLAQRQGARVVLMTRPHKLPVAEQEQRPGWRRRIPAYNRALLEFAHSHGVPVVDVQALFAGRADLFIDECHFSAAGHRLLAEHLVRELAPLLPGQ